MLCPRCRTNELPRFPALSRADNKTNICSECGQDEAWVQFTSEDHGVQPVATWPVVRVFEVPPTEMKPPVQ